MKKILPIIIVLALVGVGAYFFLNSKKGAATSEGITSGAKSISELLTSQVPQKCTFSYSDDEGKTEGTTFVSGGKVRSDATNTVEGKTTISHIITDNKTSYIWTDGEKNGFKMTVDAQEETETDATGDADTPASQDADLDKQTDYSCSAWIPDNSLFTPPTNVTFTDFSQMTAPQGAGSAPSTGSQCSYCTNLTGEDKDACLSAFGCN